MTNSLTSTTAGSMWMAASTYLGFDYADKPANSAPFNLNNIVTNAYYNQHVFRTGNNIFVKHNNVISGCHNITTQAFNLIGGGLCAIGKAAGFNSGLLSTNSYIDNFKSMKNYQGVNVLDKPAIHMPLESNRTSVGYLLNNGNGALSISHVGAPSHTTIGGKKCIKFGQNQYLFIDSHNIFNLGTVSDFYIEFDYYNLTNFNYNVIFSNQSVFNSNSLGLLINPDNRKLRMFDNTKDYVTSDSVLENNVWNKIKWYRVNGSSYIQINNESPTKFNAEPDVNLSYGTFYVGTSGWATSDYLNGYMADFKMFVGTSTIPETYHDKKVLDLNFKPTRKSYLFKDNNNKCVIHPVNINYRDYQDSQYCCTFNGTDQYLHLGKNDLFNFGLDDFVISVKLKYQVERNYLTILSGGSATGGGSNNSLIIVADKGASSTVNSKSVHFKMSGNVIFNTSANSLLPDVINTITVTRTNGVFNLYINEVLISTHTSLPGVEMNFNFDGNTLIGKVAHGTSENFKGQIYSIKVLRNTTDITLLNSQESVGESCREVIVPNPPINVTYPLKLNLLDSFNSDWKQLNINSPVTYKELGSGNTGLFFNGTGGLVSTNKNYRLGMSKFTIDLDILLINRPSVSYPACLLSYGRAINMDGWYNLEITSTGVIRFGTQYDNSYISSAADVIKQNVKHSIGVTRDENKILRIFVDNVKVAEGSLNILLDGGDPNNGNQNYMMVGRNKFYYANFSSTYGYQGFIDNLYINRGICKYTETPVRVPIDYKLSSKSLLNIGVESIGTTPATVLDSFNNSLVWTNSGVNVVTASSLRPARFNFTSLSQRLVAQSTNFELNKEDFTIDVIFTPNQTIAEAVLFDLRKGVEPYKGIIVSQSASSPASLTIDIGSSLANTAVDYSYNTGVNSISSGLNYHLRVVRNLGTIYIFLNGLLKGTLSVNTSNIPTDSKVTLGNNNLNSKGFNGTITQFRLIKGIATNTVDFDNITEELK